MEATTSAKILKNDNKTPPSRSLEKKAPLHENKDSQIEMPQRELPRVNDTLIEPNNLNKHLHDTMIKMHEYIRRLEYELKTQQESQKESQNEAQAVYSTDEEELAIETEWIRDRQKGRKRKLNTTATPPQLKET